MKPWLLNILACPIDKHHPLNARFFTLETSTEEIHKIVSEAGELSPYFRKNYRHLTKQLKDGTISPPAIKAIEDFTGSEEVKRLHVAASEAVDRLKQVSEKSEQELMREYAQEVDTLYRFLNLIEVDKGLLVCPKCRRWYPIGSAVETIPELLPDDLREKERDLAWLEHWRKLVPDNVLEEGKPFNLGK